MAVKQYITGSWQQTGVLKAHDGSGWTSPKIWNGTAWA